MTGTLHDDLCTLTITSRSFILRMRNVSGKCCTENQNTRFVLNDVSPKIFSFMR